MHVVALKLPEFWADNTRVWLAQTQAQFYYCVAALGRADAAQVVDLIKFPPDELPYESLKEYLTELHTLKGMELS